ncbi:MAG: methyltransferase [Telluria sp.]
MTTLPPDSGAPPTHVEDALLSLGRQLLAGGYRFVTVTPATHARVNERAGNEWARSIEDVLGWSRPFRQEIVTPAMFDLMRAAGMLAPHPGGWRSTLRASTLAGQLYFHSAYPTSGDDAVFFGPDTYRYVRAVAAALDGGAYKVARAVDVGCGSGPGAVAIARRFPEAEVIASDINRQALALARVNCRLAGTSNVVIRASNLLHDLDGEFDLIISNPPYILDPHKRTYRDGGGDLGMGLSLDIVDAAIERLAPGGALMLYTGIAIVSGEDRFLMRAGERLAQAGFSWTYDEIDPDVFGGQLGAAAYASADRIAAVLLTAARPQRQIAAAGVIF